MLSGTPRTQQDRSRTTRAALISTARRLFAERGYAAVSAGDVVTATGLTRGALHHHFGDKAGLFRAVFERVEAELGAELEVAVGAGGVAAGVGAFLDICQRPEVVRIALTDAPVVLGWQTWRAIEAEHGLGLIVGVIEQAMADGAELPRPPELLAQLVLSVLIEAALLIASGTPRESVEPALLTMLAGLFGAR
ncbi:TetR/AcrR family transcriptional regulator [Actinophytocola sp.]|uniref:TetR/AcrR family transcriptional regulator n=1 Tax=Actinophytocola sp. TaxID=1872138 RepID=UPI002D7F8689|nr:TetR/AcrR family transcriptional regulator [Actinophytocola sp.]HET9143003.1 TetR/AcrR family transcriptional regulator [Actinophytocola sp.]